MSLGYMLLVDTAVLQNTGVACRVGMAIIVDEMKHAHLCNNERVGKPLTQT